MMELKITFLQILERYQLSL